MSSTPTRGRDDRATTDDSRGSADRSHETQGLDDYPRSDRATRDGSTRRPSSFALLASRPGVATVSELVDAGSVESTPQQRRIISYTSLVDRARSNPRTRTPMMYESPLNTHAFRRHNPEDRSPPPRREGQRVTVRPLAGMAVGTVATRPIREADIERPSTARSSKQGPSRRKARRWDNDNFVGVASELAGASCRGPAVAQLLLQAKADAPLYLSVYDPRDRAPSCLMTKFISDDEMKPVRDKFFAGEIGLPINSIRPSRDGVHSVDQGHVGRSSKKRHGRRWVDDTDVADSLETLRV